MIAFVLILERFARTIHRGLKDPEFRGLLFITLSVIGLGTIFYSQVEGWRWVDALYFTVITLTTVGYGDFAPQTDLGKFFTVIYIFIGLGILFAFVDKIAEGQRERLAERRKKRQGRKEGESGK